MQWRALNNQPLNEVLNPMSHQFEVFQSVGVSLEVS